MADSAALAIEEFKADYEILKKLDDFPEEEANPETIDIPEAIKKRKKSREVQEDIYNHSED
jgi:hypothetical protein